MARTLDAHDAVSTVLAEAMARSPLTVVRETVAGPSGRGDDLPAERVLTVPIADRAAVGLALGVALAGGPAVVELAGTGRLPAALEVLAEAGALAAAGEFAVPLVVRVPYGGEAGGLDAPVGAFLCDLPGVRVVCPSTPALAAGLARWALGARSPVVLLEPRALAHVRGEIGDEAIAPAAGLVRSGRHATVAAFGAGVQAAVDAAAALALEGIDVDVIDLVSLAPLDLGVLGARVRATGRLVVAHPGDRALAARIRETAVDAAFLYLEAPLADAHAEAQPITEAVRRAVHY